VRQEAYITDVDQPAGLRLTRYALSGEARVGSEAGGALHQRRFGLRRTPGVVSGSPMNSMPAASRAR
jgi:hypothetical protein